MAVSILRYSSVNTKARALFSKLLKTQDYEELLVKPSVQDIAAYLKKNTAYGVLLTSVNTSLVHRGELEQLFRISLFNDFIKLLRFLSGDPAEFLKASFRRYEIEDLKMLFRVIYTGRNSEAVKSSMHYLKNFSDLDFSRLITSDSLQQLISNLKGTEYYKALSHFTDNSKPLSLFDIEMSLDLHFFLNMIKLKDKLLTGADRARITHTFGIEIDLQNIMMIYRCRKLFSFPQELTLKYIIPEWYHLSREQLVSLIESRDLEDFKRLLEKTAYAGIFASAGENRWEINISNYMHETYKSHLRQDSFNLGSTMAYLHLKELDIKNIIALIEGIRYNLPKEEIKSYLIGINK